MPDNKNSEESDREQPPATVLIVGASGFVGSAVLRRLRDSRCGVVALSRRRPHQLGSRQTHQAVDLLDPLACRRAAASWGAITHVVYAAVNETPGDLVASWTDPLHAERNGRMFDNLLDALLSVASGLRHITVVHGTKAYASHRPEQRPIVPLRESLPRPPHDDFYFRQEDSLTGRQHGTSWHWTVLRAPMIAGGSRDSNLNALLALAVFASLRKDAGRGLPFTGAGSNLGVMEMVDVDLLARAAEWTLKAEKARNEVFNVANGDVYVWPDLMPTIADAIGLPTDPPEPLSLVAAIAAEADRWAALVRRHELDAPTDWRELLGESAALADFALGNCSQSVLTSTIKIRQAGFNDCIDTRQSVVRWIERWRTEKLLPP